jgi:hypothetical protein
MVIGSSKLFAWKSSAVISFGGVSLGVATGDPGVPETFGVLEAPAIASREASLRHAEAQSNTSTAPTIDAA